MPWGKTDHNYSSNQAARATRKAKRAAGGKPPSGGGCLPVLLLVSGSVFTLGVAAVRLTWIWL